MYTKAGGTSSNVCIYYSLPGQTLETGIKLLEGDVGIRELLRDYKGLDVIPLYIEENPGPIIVVDSHGNIIENTIPLPQLMYEGNPGLRETEGGVEGEIGIGEEADSGGEGDDEGEHEVQNEEMGASDEGLAPGECDVQNDEMGAGDEGLAEGEDANTDILIICTPPNDAENVQTSCVSNQVPTQRQQNVPAYRLPRPQNVPAYRPPRPQTVPQPSAQNVNQQPSQASTCSQTKRKVPKSSSQDAFKRQCCPPKKSSISSVFKGVADSYRPRTQASGSSSTVYSPGN
ncbi:hypothetical protein Salat_2562500 [Sesamum alatum]|uniref:Uncharacterized protein n=1 Tax=Sesamum alatum TaxID=300844 RepID=A0AAE1XSS0_9LAMI|nr:hypothetical protein Salat_2562500 [Sesamum alatum]